MARETTYHCGSCPICGTPYVFGKEFSSLERKDDPVATRLPGAWVFVRMVYRIDGLPGLWRVGCGNQKGLVDGMALHFCRDDVIEHALTKAFCIRFDEPTKVTQPQE